MSTEISFTLFLLFQCLSEWDANDPRALLLGVEQLLGQYRNYQHQLVENNDRLRFEYNALIEQTELTPDDIEVLIYKSEVSDIQMIIYMSGNIKMINDYLII